MKIACLADLHGHLPAVPPVDLILLGGDICPVVDHSLPRQCRWLNLEFTRWLLELPAPVIACAGNHDLIFERAPWMIPTDLPWTYLEDSVTTFNGYKIYGSPWQPTFGSGWAFNLDELQLKHKWASIPYDTDILLLHGPPHGYGDLVEPLIVDTEGPNLVHVGSPSLTEKIKLVKPKLCMFGHIHPAFGRYQLDETILINAALVDSSYAPTHSIIVVELPDKEK